MDNYGHRGTKIARNTLMLYVRMLVLMLVGLYTSRVVLGALGENDFGVYNVVGGVVSMFTIISGALNSAVSRFITFEMGKGADAQLNKVYSTAVTIQLILAAVVVLLAEPLGLWFIDNKMTIDPSRIPAARWVLHFSLLAFVINLMSVPQMASITAHEHMSAYAYIGILDGLLRLGVAFLILHSPIDRLIYYAALMAGVVLIVRLAYGLYCRLHFEECRYRPVFDRPLIKEMFSFAGWNFIGVTSGVLRDHGGNILVNLFSGPAVNAARGVAVQLNGAVQGFVTNFMTAVNPQITKSYAAGEKEYMFSLVRRSSRMSFFLLFLIALPVIFNADYLLSIWLKEVPEHSSLFVQLFLIFALSESLSNPMITAMLATGNIRNYQLVVGGIQLLNLPVSYVCLRMGAIPEVTVIVAIIISQICMWARLLMLSKATGFPVLPFLEEVYFSVLFKVVCGSLVVPLILEAAKPAGFVGFLISASVCVLWSMLVIMTLGLQSDERKWLVNKIKEKFVRK
ncbi:MAG: lipopolysaccharide biosynthesis protein [Bacteroidales bacterium]|nr:lipopolysaccharide biosynthesis protein [Bacteroidales bacterium]